MDKRRILSRKTESVFQAALMGIVLALVLFFSHWLAKHDVVTGVEYIPVLVCLIALVLLVIIFRYKAKKEKEDASIHFDMLTGLANEWDTIMLFDLDTDTGHLLKAPQRIHKRYVTELSKGAKSFFEFYVEKIVSDDYKEFVKPALSRVNVVSRLISAPQFTLLYNITHIDKSRHHYEAKLIRIDDFELEHKFIFAARSIDDQDDKEAELRHHLEESVATRTEELKEKNERLNRLNEDIIGFLGNIVEARDLESGEHVRRVKGFTHILAEQLMHDCPEYKLTEERIDLISSASALHDLGKIAIPDAILLKPGRLTKEEFEIMKDHSTKGCEILKMAPMDWSEEYLFTSLEICKYHHEKYDGSGYPEGLRGDEIPISAQIVSVVDCYDALINKRCYKDAYSFDVAYQMIMNGECGAFSPKILSAFTKCREKFEAHALNKDSSFNIRPQVKTADTSLEGIRILIVEDDALSREITTNLLSESGAIVYEASNGAEAIKMYTESEGKEYDAILMDIFMPGMDGFETTSAIRNSKIRGSETIPIIAISISHSEIDVNRATEMGMNAYLFKPISINKVSKALVNCMRDRANELQRKLIKTNRVANRDSLTGVRSMAAYMDKVEELKEYINKGADGSFGLVECDLNGLKTVNDTYGHDIGDVYIVNSCKAICDVFRHSPVFRIGGDEFVVVLENEDLRNSKKLVEQLKEMVEESCKNSDPVHGSFSIASGLAIFDSKTDKTVGDVLKRADIAMYNNKKVMHMTLSD